MQKFWGFVGIVSACFSAISSATAQYIDLSGSTPFIRQYVQEAPENWEKSIIFVFYDNAPCPECARAMGMIYDVYEQNYANQFSYFEINYQDEGEFPMQLAYNLQEPLAIVLVRINDGMSRGFSKIDNMQYWVNNPLYFKEKLMTAINDFLVD